MSREVTPMEAQPTVLVVQQDAELGYLLQVLLEDAGAAVRVAATAEQASSVLEVHTPTMILLDLILPDADGRRFLARLREDQDTRQTPVLMMSTHVSPRIESECLASGADGFIEKPFDPRIVIPEMMTRLRRHAERSHEEDRDPLTGLLDRSAFRKKVERRRTDESSWLAMVEVDGFGALARERGWEIAEEVLSGLGGAIGRVADSGGIVAARWEGPEFALLLSGRAEDEVGQALEEVLEAVRQTPHEAADRETFRVTASAGFTATDPDREVEQEIDEVRRIVFHVQENGGNRVSGQLDPSAAGAAKILIVEDDEVAARLLVHRLEREGFEVKHFANGMEAFEAALEYHPNLVILDLKLPGMDGYELLGRLRRIPTFADVPIMLVTSLGGEEQVVRGFDLGADDFMQKPVSPIEFTARVRRLLKYHA